MMHIGMSDEDTTDTVNARVLESVTEQRCKNTGAWFRERGKSGRQVVNRHLAACLH